MGKTYIDIIHPSKMKPTLINRFKTWIWNLILPPHIRLSLPDIDKDKE